MIEKGPIYGVELIDELPLGKVSGLTQAMASRADLEIARRYSDRTAAAYEVLLGHWRREKAERERLQALLKAIGIGDNF
jgi:hypothetical protein